MPTPSYHILPFSCIVGQERLKTALELVHIEPRLGGVLISGHRGTAKSTAVRAFGLMMHGSLPVTLPLNASEDRVVGHWAVKALVEEGKLAEQKGILEEAANGVLYIDEVNLLEEHIVDILLDVTATGVLTVERDGKTLKQPLTFSLVGTMNPEESGLRPQLTDRFGLMANVTTDSEPKTRAEILRNVLALDVVAAGGTDSVIEAGRAADLKRKAVLESARAAVKNHAVTLPPAEIERCVQIAHRFSLHGHRGEHVISLAARARAALRAAEQAAAEGTAVAQRQVQPADVRAVARLALEHRKRGGTWDKKDDELLEGL